MNRDVRFVEFKNGEQSATIKELVTSQLSKINEPSGRVNSKHWAFYCNDKRMDHWTTKIRPRSKLLLVARDKAAPEIDIAFENKQLVVLNKPSNLPTQATLKDFEDNLYERIRYHYILDKGFPAGIPYVGLHHRLDRGTSGLVLMTKQRSANKEISDLFKNRRIRKTYRARTEQGVEEPIKKWRQTDHIRRGSTKKLKFFFEVHEEGDQAITEFQWAQSGEGFHEFLCHPITGRTHQLRVQLAYKGYPILGDRVYGKKESAKRLMLHAERLQFYFNNQDYDISSPIEW